MSNIGIGLERIWNIGIGLTPRIGILDTNIGILVGAGIGGAGRPWPAMAIPISKPIPIPTPISIHSPRPIQVQILEGEDAIAKYREVMGSTNPQEASPGTIRADFADSIDANAVHGSDSPDSAKREIDYFFS